MTLFSAITGVWLTEGDNNVFTQISFLVLAGLACKNAILIVEFARQREAEGEAPLAAILDACRVRLRPVLMTSLAFIMGVVPLVFSSGPGFEIRQAMGVAVFAGMLGVTLVRFVPDAGVLHRDQPSDAVEACGSARERRSVVPAVAPLEGH